MAQIGMNGLKKGPNKSEKDQIRQNRTNRLNMNEWTEHDRIQL